MRSWRGPLKCEGPAGGAGEEQHGHGGRRRARMEVCARDDFGFTALHYAAQSGLAKCIEYLLAHGANAFAETRDLTRRMRIVNWNEILKLDQTKDIQSYS